MANITFRPLYPQERTPVCISGRYNPYTKKHIDPYVLVSNVDIYSRTYVRGGADKYLDRPGRKQVTATKLGIYSTYSPRSSIHFLALCSNSCKPLKKS